MSSVYVCTYVFSPSLSLARSFVYINCQGGKKVAAYITLSSVGKGGEEESGSLKSRIVFV